MRYKPHAPTRRRTVTVPRLDGGLNLYDPPTAVADNQLTACTNMWFHRGALRVRPALINVGGDGGDFNIVQPIGDDAMLLMDYHAGGNGNRLFRAVLRRADGTVERFGQGPLQFLELPNETPTAPYTAFGCYAPQGMAYDFFFFLGGGEIIGYRASTGGLYGVSPYRPQVVTDGAPTVAYASGSPAGKLLEYPSLLSNEGFAAYSTDGRGTYFYLPADFRGASLTLRLAGTDAMTGEPFLVDPMASPVANAETLGFDPAVYTYVTVRCDYTPADGVFRVYGEGQRRGGGTDVLPLPAYTRNNLTADLVGYRGYDPTAVSRMTMATWYGGVRGGVIGGTRLFLAGDSRHPHRLVWSQADNPLYFPDRNLVTVGDSHTAVTALAKHEDRLIVFKEREIYCADYVSESDPVSTVSSDPEEVQAARAHFPMTPLSTDVGCDAPATVRGVNNRLVWMTAEGKIYMLTAADIYNNRCVREISSLIEPALIEHSFADRKRAGGGAYNGRYLLAIGNTVYVLDCRSPAFLRFGRGTDERTALRSLVYHRWVIEDAPFYRMITGDGTVVFLAIGEHKVAAYRPTEGYDPDAAVTASFATRHFPCDDPTRRMSVEAVYGEMTDPAHPVRVSVIADGETHEAAVITAATTDERKRLIPRRLAPVDRRVAALGIRCDGEVGYAVGALTLVCRQNGRIR